MFLSATLLPFQIFGLFALAPNLNDDEVGASRPDPDSPDPEDTEFVTVALAGVSAPAVTPAADADGNLSVTGIDADEDFAIAPTDTTPLLVDPGGGTDEVSAGLFHDVTTKATAMPIP